LGLPKQDEDDLAAAVSPDGDDEANKVGLLNGIELSEVGLVEVAVSAFCL